MKMNYTHEAMADLIIQEPTVSHSELAEVFGYSAGWVTRVINSDSFQALLAARKEKLVDPLVARSLNDRLRSVTIKAIGIIDSNLSKEEAGAAYALEALGVATGAMVKGAK